MTALVRRSIAARGTRRTANPGIRVPEIRQTLTPGGSMSDRVGELESSVAALSSELASLRARVASLEAGAAPALVSEPVAVALGVDVEQVEGWLALMGRTLVILGGAFLLRALTSAHVVPYAVGVGAGLVYGAPWLLLASRSGARGRLLDAFCYGLSTALIGYPLVWEATTRFAVFTPAQSALILGGLTAAAFVLSAVWRLHSLAAIVTCGALVSALGLAIATEQWLSYTVLALAVGITTLWLGYVLDWVLLRWPAALVVDLLIVVVTGRAAGQFWPVLAVVLAVIGAYLGSFAARTLRKGRTVIPFEVAQSIGILTIVLPCLFGFVAARPAGVFTAAAVVFAAGIAIYAVAFTMVERHAPVANLFFYSLVALTLSVTGAAIAAPSAAPVLYAAAGLTAALASRRGVPVVLWTQAAFLIAGGAIASGMIVSASAALAAPYAAWSAPGWAAWAGLAGGIGAVMVAPRRDGPFVYGITAARLVLSGIVVWSAAGGLVYVLGAAAARVPGWGPGWLATLRTVVAVAITVGVAYASRRDAWRETGWLTYPLLVLLGVKLLASDLPTGRPLTLFLALAAYGIALIAAPRARRVVRRA
jgi:hypothetical protein